MTAMKALSVLAATASLAQAIDLSKLTGAAYASKQASGTAEVRVRDWDCKASPFSPVEVCDVEDNPIPFIGEDGPAFTCSRQHVYAKSASLAYGFATVVSGDVDAQIAGACYKLTYTAGADATSEADLSAKTLVVQATNVTEGVGESLFDLAIPGSGKGLFSQQACVEQFSAPPAGYGRAVTKADCDKLPSLLQSACRFRFDWNSDLPTPKRQLADLTSAVAGALEAKVDWMRVRCPSELVSRSKFALPDDDSFPAAPSYIDDITDEIIKANVPGEIIKYINEALQDTDVVPVNDVLPVSDDDDLAPASDAAPIDTDVPSVLGTRDGPPQQEFAQCGGQNYAGPTNCDQGLSCKDQSPYYSQCMRDVQKIYGQCGGKGFNGPSQCEEGLQCNVVHAKYSQCQPAPSTQTVNSPTPVEARDSAQTLYGQCSGTNWKGATTCAAGLECFTRDATYGQCLQTVQLKFEQCGGALYVGPNLCVAGSKCKKLRSDYSQCIPDDDNEAKPEEPTPEEPTPSAAKIDIDPVHGGLDRDPKHVATAADGVGNEATEAEDSKDSKKGKDGNDDDDRPTVTDGVSGAVLKGSASVVAPSALLGLTVLSCLFL